MLTSSQTAGARTGGSRRGRRGRRRGIGIGRGRITRRLRHGQPPAGCVARRCRRTRAIDAASRQLNASGRAIQVWDGDWLQNGDEAGKGLAGVRQAIAMEVAFAPADCRTEAMRGLVLLTLGDGAGASRIALGAPAWRWSDLLEID
ncbi:hypothetical protein [Brevundimonas denitrificans]|uniref:hypothetical protein n=1 Tax=Brevundimonas denitrificans TaxID=1443434 RepID=UPI00223B81AF|nr:hypothetical protein [Brevundimonas denitrificans]